MDRIEVREVQIPGVRIAYRQAGTGPSLVLLHGGMEDSRAWIRQLDGLSDEFTVFAWDAPGCGAYVGHLVNVEAPAAFNGQVRRFVRSVPQTGQVVL